MAWTRRNDATRSRHGDHLPPSPRSSPSEVQLLSARNVGVAVVVIILMEVFSTDGFRQNIRSRHIGQGRGSRRREDTVVAAVTLDRFLLCSRARQLP